MGAVQSHPTPDFEPPVKLSPLRVYLSRGKSLSFLLPFSPSLLRIHCELREIYANQDTSSVIARVPNLERYISGAKKKYVRIRREGPRGVEIPFFAAEVENELFALIPCQVTLHRAIRKARDSHFLKGNREIGGRWEKSLSAQSDK